MWYVALCVLALLAVAILLLAKRQQLSTLSTLQANKSVYESRLLELEEDRKQDLLTDKDLANAQRELKKAFVTDVHDPDEQVSMKPASISWVIAVVVISALGLYLWAGSWQQQRLADHALAQLEERSQRLLNDSSGQIEPEEMMLFALGLRQRLGEKPNASAWSLYGRIMLQLGQLDEGIEAFEQSQRLEPKNISNLMYYSQSLIMSGSDNDLARAAGFVRTILEEDRGNVDALALLGVIAYERGDYERAVQAWELTLQLLNDGDPRLLALEKSLADAKARADGSVLALTVNVNISEQLRNEIPFGATLFVFVRDPDGGRAPIAVVRQVVADFPVTVTLTDADALMTATGLSDASNWLVGARLTRSGTIEMEIGDMEARPVVVEAGPGLNVELRLTEMRQ
ncbi:c-type cytochrome biogenesis protein CcmI [Aliidiomarina quisquiliarum]|uniref:c-type cytochrome biogenesis protein CcmI n=1 Tax=Aliidiomarina quisquiliarum TaxID=2938947 RepID=UPI00208FCE9D|nr:c-type cytochrome biogenesis protein CcmI [Aliidiomarina quisquiliarum]MCO4321697.1 c-type cytochrome biogenesis protein CcmI [Aliidiomarina quisquiliarum]